MKIKLGVLRKLIRETIEQAQPTNFLPEASRSLDVAIKSLLGTNDKSMGYLLKQLLPENRGTPTKYRELIEKTGSLYQRFSEFNQILSTIQSEIHSGKITNEDVISKHSVFFQTVSHVSKVLYQLSIASNIPAPISPTTLKNVTYLIQISPELKNQADQLLQAIYSSV
jgi:hypothetical protein